ncbi:MAG TPA: PepSY-associated TM helix domain-containing protein [Methylocella sp.]|nr:PepSY-associated TM helix domain-containing protein [Methylocella sp.]
MTRAFWVWLHRWAGLAMALFLIIVGLTGSVLAFRDELDVWLNPELLTVTPRDAPLLDGFVLREKAAALYPETQFDDVPLDIKPSRSVPFVTGPPLIADDYMAKAVVFYLDPYTGEKLGERNSWSGPSLAHKDIISFLYRLHFALALPWSTGELGATILGITAFVWTIDCFVGFYLTFPLRWRVNGDAPPGAKSWWSRWKPAWLIKLNAGAYRINFDIHRAFGLWTWLMLFIFAWSSVGFNLSQVYKPVMQTLFGLSQPMAAGLPARAEPLDHPRLGWREAYATGHALLGEQARQHGFVIEKEKYLNFDRDQGVYVISAQSSLDGEKSFRTSVTFDADTGAMLQAAWPGSTSEPAGDVLTRWLYWLHLAAVFGLPMQIFVCIMGFVITALSVTGVYIWWKKRRARRFSNERRGAAAGAGIHQPPGLGGGGLVAGRDS